MAAIQKMTRSKIKGMLVGGAIGDALGAPVETWTPERMVEVHGGRITKYVPPIGHKWFKPDEFFPGMTTDDTQLTVATMRGLIDGKAKADEERSFDPYMDAIAKAHIEASKHTVGGWGTTTQEAVRRLSNGVHWKSSGKTTEEGRGTGNGVPMKVAPLAAWFASPVGADFDEAIMDGKKVEQEIDFQFNVRVVEFGAMTHSTQISSIAGVMHAQMVYLALWSKPGSFVVKQFLDLASQYLPHCMRLKGDNGEFFSVSHLKPADDDLLKQISGMDRAKIAKMTVDQIREKYKGGCYVYETLPFAYAFFLRHTHSMEAIIECVNAGGDTDTNAKLVGELLGANEGIEFFEQPENRWAIEGLRDYEVLTKLADEFCDMFGVK
jgi:ADP-ribosylglycohydrolase